MSVPRVRETVTLVKVDATLEDSGGVVGLEGLTAELFDKDPLSVDRLAKTIVGPKGRVEFIVDLTKANDLDSLGEGRPDLFVVVKDRALSEPFRDAVMSNVGFPNIDPVTGAKCTTVDAVFRLAS